MQSYLIDQGNARREERIRQDLREAERERREAERERREAEREAEREKREERRELERIEELRER